ncbi:hypothetical protein Lal_00016825 [Lupinus albus]|nr:hypothetical protein Lal_00016825 [Lupinus albus]
MAWIVEQGFHILLELEVQRSNNFPLHHVGGLASDGSPLGVCNNELWSSYDSMEMYKSYLRGLHYYVQGELTKAGSMTVENMLQHYLIAYIFVQRNKNHDQPIGNDLKLMYVVKEKI